MMKINKKVLLALALSSISSAVFASSIIPSNSGEYYSLGGGSDISMPAVSNSDNLNIGADLNTNLGYTCDGFNPAISISNMFNHIGDSIEGLKSDVINSATGAIGSLPMYVVEKASPELYSLLQNTMADGKDNFRLSMKSCNDALSSINKGQSPYEDWFSVSDSQGWLDAQKRAKQGQDVDITDTKKNIAKDPKAAGVPWTHKGKNSGGTDKGEVSIKVIYDVVVAGYNALIDPERALDDINESAPETSPLFKYWKNADAAGKWARLVLGDITISAKEDQVTHPGVGLTTLLQTCPDGANNDLTCVKNINQNIIDIVQDNGDPSAEEIEKISTNEMVITPDVINSIRNMPTATQAVAISKLSQDVAIQNLVDQALILRRLLIAGSQTKPVHNLASALKSVDTTVDQLDKDIKDLMFEHDIREKMMTSTVRNILSDEELNKSEAASEHSKTQAPTVINGAVYKDQ